VRVRVRVKVRLTLTLTGSKVSGAKGHGAKAADHDADEG